MSEGASVFGQFKSVREKTHKTEDEEHRGTIAKPRVRKRDVSCRLAVTKAGKRPASPRNVEHFLFSSPTWSSDRMNTRSFLFGFQFIVLFKLVCSPTLFFTSKTVIYKFI